IRLSSLECVSDLLFERADRAGLVAQFGELGELGRGTEQPVFQFGALDTVMVEHRLDAPLQLVAVIFEADEQDTTAPEDVLAAQGAADGQRDELQQPQRSLAAAARGDDGRDEAAAELVAEQPLPRRDWSGFVAGIPFVEAIGVGGLATAIF